MACHILENDVTVARRVAGAMLGMPFSFRWNSAINCILVPFLCLVEQKHVLGFLMIKVRALYIVGVVRHKHHDIPCVKMPII